MSRVGFTSVALLCVLLVGAGAAVGARADGEPSQAAETTTTVPGGTTTTSGTVPSAPTLVVAKGGTSQVDLAWNASGDGGSPILGYRIYRGTAPDGEVAVADVGTYTKYVDTKVVSGTTYYYEVTAVNANGESVRSNELSASLSAATLPGAPTLTSATPSVNRITLAWDPPAGDGGSSVSYKIYRGTSSGGEAPLTTITNALTYADTTAIGGTTYFYEVSAVNSTGEGPRSAELSATALRALFRPFEAFDVGSWPEAVAIGDVTGDGQNDVVMTTGYYFDPMNDYRLFVFAQASDGTLKAPVSYAVGSTSKSVAIGDITGDGRADVVVGVPGQGVQVFPQLASGTLGTPVLTASANSDLIRLGRLNGDGLLDVVGVGSSTGVMLNDGHGGLQAPTTYPTSGTDLEVGDVTGDGRDDIVVKSSQISVLGQLAGGGFGPAAVYSGGSMSLSGIGLGDVTGDGRNDVVASYGGNKPSSFVAVLAQTASGALAAPVSYASYDIPEPIDAADLDLDGRGDVVTLHGGWNAAGVYRQQNDGTLGPEERYSIPYASSYEPHALAVGDVNGDGSRDLALADYNNGLVVLANTNGAPPPPPPTADVPGTPTLDSATAGNASVSLAWTPPALNYGAVITGYKVYRGTVSGAETVLTTLGVVHSFVDRSAVNGTTYYYRVSAVNGVGEGGASNERSATPTAPTVPGAPVLTSATGGVSSVSLAWSTPSNGGAAITSYKVYRGTSSGGQTLLTSVSNVNAYTDTGAAGGTTYYYKVSAVNSVGEGARSNERFATANRPLFAAYQATRTGSWPEAVAIGDVTGDGRNDVVVATSFYFDPANDYRLFVFAQTASGTLAPPVSYATAATYNNRPKSIAIGDVTGDGRADVVVGLESLGIQIFPQLASGSLGSPALTPTYDSAVVALGQLDGDGRLDVVGIGPSTGVFLNDGNGGLRAPVTYATDGYDVVVADITGDGRDDLVVRSSQISVLPQLAAGGFGGPAMYSAGSNDVYGIGSGDVTGDGRDDVVTSYGGNRPSSFISVVPQTVFGTLGTAVSYPSYDIPEPINTADFDLDGRADVVTLHGGWNAAGVYRQQTDGTLAAEERYTIPYASHYNSHGLAVGDLDGNGSPDLAVADYNQGLVVLRNVTQPAAVPGAPNLTAAVAANGSVGLVWRAPVSPVSGYRVYRGIGSGAKTLLVTLGTTTGFVDSSALNGTTYSYEVSAVNARGEGAHSNERSATPRMPDGTGPSQPAGLKLVVAGTHQLALDWASSTDNVGVSGYEIYRGGVLVGTANASQYLDSGLAAGTTYTYAVRAVDAAGNKSSSSSSVSAKTVALSTSKTGTLAGLIYDAPGAPLANAVVKLTSPNGAVKSLKTNATGVWKFTNLAPASYTLTVSLSGYSSRTLGVSALAGQTVLAAVAL